MNPEELLIRKYIENKVCKTQELAPYIKESSILWIENDPGLVWDIMVLLPDNLFSEFINQYGECFVIDDHEHLPWIFIRVKDLQWLENDFKNRFPIALWVYENSLVLQDKEGRFVKILQEQKKVFAETIHKILERKYLEFRTERHNLRHALERKNMISTAIIKATIVKLVLEMSFLVEEKPYPYKKWLPLAAEYDTNNGKKLLKISRDFLNSDVPTIIIDLSDQLVSEMVKILTKTKIFPKNFLQKWWLYLK